MICHITFPQRTGCPGGQPVIVRSAIDQVLSDYAVKCTDPCKLDRLGKAVKDLFPADACVKLGNPCIESCLVRFTVHECPVEPCYELSVIDILVSELGAEEETMCCASSGISLVCQLTGPCHESCLIGISSEASGIKPCSKVDSTLIRLDLDIRNTSSAAADSILKAKISPFCGVNKSFNYLFFWSTIVQYFHPGIESCLIRLTVKECTV